MKTKVIQIGNSKGVRLPKPILEECGISDEIEVSVVEETIVIQSARTARKQWGRKFSAMARKGDDELKFPDLMDDDFDREEWEW